MTMEPSAEKDAPCCAHPKCPGGSLCCCQAAEKDAHEVAPEWVPVCGVCWEPVHQDDDERWVHTSVTSPAEGRA